MCTHIPGPPQRWPAVHGRPGAPRWCPKPGPPGAAPRLALGQLGSKGEHTTFAKGFSLLPSPAQGHISGSESSRVRRETQTSWASPPKGTLFQKALEAAKLSFEFPSHPDLRRRPIPSHSHVHFPEAGGEDEGRQDPPLRQALAEPELGINMLRL